MYEIIFSKNAVKDIRQLSPKLKNKIKDILRKKIAIDPYSGKKLVGDLKGLYSVRLTFQDKIIYGINDQRQVVIVYRTRSHYGD
ncbi:MAG: type II toxin-antitoxin system mRNA interferase toxin, RelE/StbE family [Proteobacteria bacterium]|nr:type II toxin-antitoxin system mRNA interferase toxin, RelE/StbE family [Pseudomonadota bacterium]